MREKKYPKKFKAVLFDLGKVLLHFNFEPAFKRLSKHTTLAPKDIEDYFVASGLEVLYDGGKLTTAEFFKEVKTALKLRITRPQFERIWNGIFTPIKPSIALLKSLKGRYRLVLISNTNAMHYAYIRKTYSFLGVLDRHVLSFKVRSRKPDPKIYREALKAGKAKPHEAFYIDDRADLTEAATELGIHSWTFRNDVPALKREMKKLGIL